MKKILICLLIPFLLAMACNMPITTNATPTANGPDYNATLLSLSIQITQTALAGQLQPTVTTTPTIQPTGTIQPTATLQPTNTTMPSSTNIPTPCNLAGNVIDVTYVDDTKVNADTSFIKTWRITNYGSCTWTSGYSLIFDSGDQMNSPASVQLTSGTVPPGNSVDVSVQLKAPHAKGTYQGNYRLKAPDGTIFGIGDGGQGAFWVRIKVPAPIVEPILLSDLKINAITTCPAPKKGVPCTIKVTIYNSGDTSLSTPFEVRLYVGTALSPKCSWIIPSISMTGGFVKSCDYTFPSWYGSISLRGIADEDNVIAEKSEGNNQLSVDISVAP